MSNCMIGFPNLIDGGTLSGGSWLAALPLANLQNRIIGKVARSSTAAAANTQFDTDFAAEKNIRVLGLTNHNGSLGARYRIRASAASTFATTLYDSGWLDVWPVVYTTDNLEWEDDNWWTCKYSDEQRIGYPATLIHILPANTLARYWRIEIDDAANAAGYVQIGRAFIGPAWQPKLNMSYGTGIGWETATEVQEALGGAEYFQRRAPFRSQRFALDWMSRDEAMGQAFELQRRAGIDQEVLWVFDPDDTVHALRRRWLGRLRELNPIEYPYHGIGKTAFEIKELL